MKLRVAVFWLHLVAGVVAGLFVFTMSATGVILAYERPWIDWAEDEVMTVSPPAPDATRLDLDAIVARVESLDPERPPSALTLRGEPASAIAVRLGEDRVVAIDPYDGEIRGDGANRLRAFLRAVMHFHRWFGAEGEGRETARAITGAANCAFVVLIATGVFVWWPRRMSRRALRAVALPSLRLRGWRRDWNWHNTLGFWAAPVLLVVSATGVAISYSWASDLWIALGGGTDGPERRSSPAPPAHPGKPFESMVAVATGRVREWESITLRFPREGAEEMQVFVVARDRAHPYQRSVIDADVATGAVRAWNAHEALPPGRRARSWVRPLHTGEAFGLVGQTLAAAASLAACMLVWTGWALTWRRMRRYADDPARRAPWSPRG